MNDKANPIVGLPERYEVIRELGRGATAIVYLVKDHFGGREAALKVANQELFRETASGSEVVVRKAWLNEVRMAGTLKHPYIVEVFDADVGANYAYLVMEYLPNGTLEPFVKPGNLKPVSEVLEIAFKCASALDYACRAGIVHRDIKPANLQYIAPGEAKVADFGAAYWSKEDSTQVMDIGSLAYMAPELFRQHVSQQGDIYALGIVLYMMLSGQRPFEAKDQASLMYKIINGERTPLESHCPDLPKPVLDVVEKMLARSIEDRYPNWPAVLAEFSALMPQLAPAKSDNKPAQSAMYDALRPLELLKAMNDAELWQMIRLAKWYKVSAGTVLIKEGADARSCYLLLKGEAKVTSQGKLLSLLMPGTLFGEMAFAEETPSPRAATVTAATDVTIGKWPYEGLRNASPEVQTKMLQIFFRISAERLRELDQRYHLLYQKSLKGEI